MKKFIKYFSEINEEYDGDETEENKLETSLKDMKLLSSKILDVLEIGHVDDPNTEYFNLLNDLKESCNVFLEEHRKLGGGL